MNKKLLVLDMDETLVYEDILVVDDTPRKAERNYGNCIQVTARKGNQSDKELLLLKEYLATLVAVPNVRLVEKRGWQKTIEDQMRSQGIHHYDQV
jgi:phosphoserine phosphatase